jgi:threonine/homoserine/homoserine lactone efflux protein
MTVFFLLKGVVVGLSISAPVGPMGLLCIRRTLSAGRVSGIVTGVGVATADAFYSSVAAFGLALVSSFLLDHRFALRLAGGSVLCLLGIRIFLQKTQRVIPAAKLPIMRLLSAYFSALLLALSNPVGIVFFTAVFAGSGLAETGGNYLGACMLVAGVCSGSLIWWVFLSTCVSLLGARFSPAILARVNQASGALIAIFGIVVLAQLMS